MKLLIAATISSLSLALAVSASAADIDWKKIDGIMAKTPAVTGNVHRYGLPRTDLKVTLDGVDIKPGFALGGWVAFEDMGDNAMTMGDLVLTESEINPVVSKMLAEGLQVTALHNHLLRATPPTFFMHVAGEGDPVKMAQSVRDALALTKTPFGPPAAAAPAATDIGIDTAKIDEAIGFKGTNNGGIYQFGVPRSDTIKQNGMTIPGAMGTAIGINFQPTGNGKAAITGDYVALATEVEPLIKALRDNGIEVTAIHSHMIDEEPRTFFIHFWANDDAVKLAKGLRAGLDAVHAPAKG